MTTIGHVRLAFALCLFASPALAQTGEPVLSALVKRGQAVEVIDDQGRQTNGRIRALSAVQLTLERAGETTEIPVDRITQISRPSDSLANGAAIGFAAGAAFGILGSTVGTSDCDDFIGHCYGGPRYIVGSTLIFGGIGAGIGVGIDALIHRNRVIYQREPRLQTRVAPVLGRGVAGAVVSVNW